jgi:hypothetical protein
VYPIQLQTFITDHGIVIFCLMDHDPTWFQGYFFPQVAPELMTSKSNNTSRKEESVVPTKIRDRIRNTNNTDTDPILHIMSTILKAMENNNNKSQLSSNSSENYPDHTWNIKPFGLLCIQEEIDECLQCQDGGYRQISMTINTFPNERTKNTAGIEQQTKKSSCTLKNNVWTGGDMMRLLLLPSSSSSSKHVRDEIKGDRNTAEKQLTRTAIASEPRKGNDSVILSVDTCKVYTGEKAVHWIEKNILVVLSGSYH